ncbi:Cytochrome P450 4d2 [Phlyctochytrium planicorne]|nr:Cytochrome P450 4d2 [Phlyctochytrium planicorne]
MSTFTETLAAAAATVTAVAPPVDDGAPKTIIEGVLRWIIDNVYSVIIVLPIGILIWWKSMVENTASGIMNSKDATPAPMVPVTIANLSRKPLTLPARILANARTLGGYYVDFILGIALVITSDPDVAKVVLSERFKSDRHVYNAASPGILAKNGLPHARLHRILTAALSDPRASKALASAFQRRLKSETFPELEEAASSKGDSIDLGPIFEELVADALTLWIAGTDEEDKKAIETLVEARRTLADLTFVVPTGITWYFDRLRDTIPLAEYVVILPGTSNYHKRRMAKKKAVEVVRTAFLRAKEKREANVSTANSKGLKEEPFYNTLAEISEADDEPLTWDETMQNLEAIQFAAEGPLFSILPNLLYLLSHDRNTQKHIQTELARLPRLATDGVRIDDLRTLPTLELAVREAIRVLPPRPFTYNRSSTLNVYKLPGMWALPERNHIIVDFMSMQRNLEIFGEDADEFKPDRFKGYDPVATAAAAGKANEKEAGAASAKFASAYMPFGNGPYVCPGQKIALDIVKIVVSEVLRRFELLPAALPSGITNPADLNGYASAQGGVLKHIAGAPVIVRRRKAGAH